MEMGIYSGRGKVLCLAVKYWFNIFTDGKVIISKKVL
jgi:hypothetical protein